MLFKITNDVVKLKAKEGFDSRYVIEEALNFVYDNALNSVLLSLKGKILTLSREQDSDTAYREFRRIQNITVEEAAKEIPNFYDEVGLPYEIVGPISLEPANDAVLIFAVGEAVEFVEKYDIKSADFKYENRSLKINKDSDVYEVCTKLKSKDLGIEK